MNKNGSAIFPAVVADLPTPVQSEMRQPSPAERDINAHKSSINRTSAPSRDVPSSKGSRPLQSQGSSTRGTAHVDYNSKLQEVSVSFVCELE